MIAELDRLLELALKRVEEFSGISTSKEELKACLVLTSINEEGNVLITDARIYLFYSRLNGEKIGVEEMKKRIMERQSSQKIDALGKVDDPKNKEHNQILTDYIKKYLDGDESVSIEELVSASDTALMVFIKATEQILGSPIRLDEYKALMVLASTRDKNQALFLEAIKMIIGNRAKGGKIKKEEFEKQLKEASKIWRKDLFGG